MMRRPKTVSWLLAAVVLATLPLLFDSSFARSMLVQMAVLAVFALSYNLLLGQTGLLSFGHAVYAGLGAFAAMHALNAFALPAPLLPLVAGVAAALIAAVLGLAIARRGGTSFAMISLAIGELVSACALTFTAVFGGEAGISGNRSAGGPLFGLDFASDLQVAYLVLAWAWFSALLMFLLRATPLAYAAAAVRDNAERAGFVGINTHHVRWLMLVIAAFFAGIAGGLMVVHTEVVSAENVGTTRSAIVLLACFIGGTARFIGPVLGAVVFVLFSMLLSKFTTAWQLYLGLFFVGLVLFAPGGLVQLMRLRT